MKDFRFLFIILSRSITYCLTRRKEGENMNLSHSVFAGIDQLEFKLRMEIHCLQYG